MRPLWEGSINFGLVNIPVRLYSASVLHEGLDLTMLHKKDKSPIRYARVCSKDGSEVAYEDIVKGYEFKKGEYVVINSEDLEKANTHKTKNISIQQFVDESDIDSRYYEKPYYLEPSNNAEATYGLLCAALAQSHKIALSKYVLHGHESMAAIQPVDNLLVLNQLRFPADVREFSELKIPKLKPTDAEMKMALELIDKQTKPFISEDWHDTYTEELKDSINAKIKGKEVPSKHPTTKPTEVKDLMAALKASLSKSK